MKKNLFDHFAAQCNAAGGFYRKTRSRSFALLCATALFSASVTVAVYACGWSFGTEHSVRFNPSGEARDYGRLPPLPRFTGDNSDRLFSWDEEVERNGEYRYEEGEKQAKATDSLWDETLRALREGDITAVRKSAGAYLERTKYGTRVWWDDPKDRQTRRNSATDMLDACLALDQGAPPEAVLAYLRARVDYDEWVGPESSNMALATIPVDSRLKDNVAYLGAAMRYRFGDSGAAEAFAEIAARYPNSEKREAAIFMSAVVSMKQSQSYGRQETGSRLQPPCTSCRDHFWQKARQRFERLIREYPQGRYRAAAQGWLAHLAFRVGDLVGALVKYYKMLAGDDEEARAEAVASLRLIRDDADEAQMRRLEQTLESEPAAALAYAYHTLYNYTLPDSNYYDDDEEAKQKAKEQKERQRVVAFATRLMHRFPKAGSGGAFVLRLAEAHLELGNDVEAANFARRALGMNVKSEHRAEALWVAGVADYRLRRYKTAREALTKLVEENPNNRYTEGARRHLAMLAEDEGDLESALEQYLALDYRHDVAYFVDVLMKPDELKEFLNERPDLKHRDELLYALGVRFLRANRWQEARQVLSSLQVLGREGDFDYNYNPNSYEDLRTQPPKERSFNPSIRGIRPQWVEMDLRTATDMERLEQEVNRAQDDEAKAEALYQLASYQYERSLLFYNPRAWKGVRHYLLHDLFYRSGFRRPGESQLLFDYMQNHDMASRALAVYLDVARRYPQTRVARDALYTAAVCHERLANYNNYWREIYESGGHAGERLVTYREVKRTYPDYQYPLGTIGWEPETRTVNGGPGWATPPKPKPRPTFEARTLATLKLLLKKARKTLLREMQSLFATLESLWQFLWNLAKCFWFGIGVVMLCLVYRRAAYARALLREELALCTPRQKAFAPGEEKEAGGDWLSIKLEKAGEHGLPVAGLDKFLSDDLRDKWVRYARDFLYRFEQLKQHRRGRAILAMSAATHLLGFILLSQLLGIF